MRIRKNANLLSLMFSHASGGPEPLQPRVCQLNQSPWDVIPFSEDTSPSSFHLFEGEDSFNGNGSLGDSIGAVESVASMMEEDGEEKAATTIRSKIDSMVIDDDDNNPELEDGAGHPDRKRVFEDYEEMEIVGRKGDKIQCVFGLNKSGGGGGGGKAGRWHCKNRPKPGETICDRHLTMLDSNGNNNHNNALSSLGLSTPSSTKKPERGSTVSTGQRRGRPRAASGRRSASSSSSNPYEFYYYSGFGPLWGKSRRSDRGGGNEGINSKSGASGDHINENESAAAAAVTVSQDTAPSYSSSSELGYDVYDDDDEEDDEDSGIKKRMRKPVKARSLKSLM
ncbi:hypothetical protein Tsubulata_027056 [Turnera subulata]|uniref:WRC domain-containing protein n=1 Tax=Turnera subulata TaxID=218843 RepID=A0A9Q0FTC4_9ROSI|nr:hypothetical protein Tsubulata_027056 [Turnera subulata]